MNDARLEQVRDWAINCVALAPFADVGDFVALGHGALDVIDAYEALRTQLAEAQERKTFPYTTPTGHTYYEPSDFKQLREWALNRAQGWMEHWDDAEMPPAETPAMFTIAWNEAIRARERETALRGALEEDLCPWHGLQPDGMKPYPFDQPCGTKAFVVTKPCERARRALLGEQANG